MKKKAGIIIAIVILAAGELVFGAWMYQTAAVDKMREAAIHEINTLVSLDDYGPKQQKKIKKILKESDDQIMEATDERTVSNIKRDAREQIGEIKTLKQQRRGWYKSLRKTVDLDAYRDKQKKEIKRILKRSKKEIYQCVKKSQTKPIIDDAKKRIGRLKTNAQLTKEEEERRQAELERQRAIAEAAAAAARAEAEAEAKAREEAREKAEKEKSSNKKKKKD